MIYAMICVLRKIEIRVITLNNHYKVGQHIKVRVTGIQPYGAFVETLTILKD